MRIDELEDKLKLNSELLKSSIHVPCGSIEVVNKEEDVMQKKFILKSVGFSLAGLAAAFVLIVNFIPGIAYASSGIPVLSDIVRVVTLGRYENTDNGYEAKVVTPKIEGLLDKELENKLNNEFKENADSIIAAYERDVKALKSEFGDETVHMMIESDYVVRTDNDDILAIDVYIFTASGSSSTKHSFYNINKKTGELIELKQLFKDDTDYITPISKYIISEMRKQNENGSGNFWIEDESVFEGFDKIKENQNFFINNLGNIVICFDKYEVAPGAYGSPEFEIPKEVIKNILK